MIKYYSKYDRKQAESVALGAATGGLHFDCSSFDADKDILPTRCIEMGYTRKVGNDLRMNHARGREAEDRWILKDEDFHRIA